MSIRPIVLRSPEPEPEARRAWRRSALTLAQDIVFVSVCTMAATVTLLASYHVYLHVYEWSDPSGHVYIESGDSRVYLVQPTAVVPPPTVVDGMLDPPPTPDSSQSDTVPSVGSDVADASNSDTQAPPLPPTVASEGRSIAPTPRADVPLPPVGLAVPAINVNVPVRMTTSDSLPQQPYAGWYFRSAFPATAGNVVLLGHVDGEAAIFDRLHELQPGDEIRVMTEGDVHVYTVEWTAFVDGSAVEMLGPIDHPVLTLITCAGEWNASRQEYESRIVVRARYVAVEERVASN